jgi:Bacteriophage probable baseplate hub protein
MIGQVRAAKPAITLNGQDFYPKLAPYFLSLEYSDNCDGQQADDLQLRLADRDKRFISDWMPDKGVFLDASIIAERWYAPNAAALSLDCGRFWIDSIDFSMPDNTVSIKATSIPTNCHVKASDETRGWENSNLKEIASQIAQENKMSLDYQSDTNPKFKRVEQDQESGLAFLKKQAGNAKLSIKVHRSTIVIFDEETYEAKPAAFTLIYGNAPLASGQTYRVSGASFSTKLTDTLKKAKVSHTNPETGRVTDSTFSADTGSLLGGDDINSDPLGDAPDEYGQHVNEDPGYAPDQDEAGGGELLVGGGDLPDYSENDPQFNFGKGADGDSAASRKAKATVRDANKDKETGSVDLALGCPLIAAGMTFNLVGVGHYDGKWFVVSAKHSLGPQFNTSLDIRRCLTGY